MTAALSGARVLVTGATGCVGSALMTRLKSVGVDAIALTRSASPHAGIVVPNYSPQLIADGLRGQPFDFVFHLGAAGVKPSEQDPLVLIDGNVAVTVAVLEALSMAPQRIVYASSSAVYGPQPGRERLREEHATEAPASLYGAAKRATEWMAQAVAGRRSMSLVSLRIFGVYGPGEAPHRLIPSLINDLRQNRQPMLTAGAQERDWIFVDDVVDALLLAATKPLRHRVYNVCSGTPVSVRTVVEAVGERLGVSGSALGLGLKPYRNDEPFFVVGDPGRFNDDTGFVATTALGDGITRSVDWATAHR